LIEAGRFNKRFGNGSGAVIEVRHPTLFRSHLA
jgi:hypothetical protein